MLQTAVWRRYPALQRHQFEMIFFFILVVSGVVSGVFSGVFSEAVAGAVDACDAAGFET